jgi:hypothetical protein
MSQRSELTRIWRSEIQQQPRRPAPHFASLNAGYFRLANRFRLGLAPGTNFFRSAIANAHRAQTASSSGSS